MEYKLSEIVGHYLNTKFQEELRTEWAVALLYRPPSLLIIWLIQRVRISPVVLTIGNLFLGLILPLVAFYLNSTFVIPIIVAIASCYSVFDCVDGGLARLRNETSKLGQYLDASSDQIYRLCLFTSIGIFIANEPSAGSLARLSVAPCIFSSWLMTFARLCRVYSELHFASNGSLKTANVGRSFVVSFVSGCEWAMPFVALVLWWNDRTWYFVPTILVFSFLDFIATQWKTIPRLVRAHAPTI